MGDSGQWSSLDIWKTGHMQPEVGQFEIRLRV